MLFALDPAAFRAAWASPLATTLTVTNASDNAAGSLRAMLATAGAGDTIAFNLPANSVIVLTSGELVVNQPVTIKGASAVNLAVSGNNAGRVFRTSAPLSIIGLTIQNGNSSGDGGGVFASSGLTLTNVNFYTNTANRAGGGAYAAGAALVTGGIFRNNRSNVSAGGARSSSPTRSSPATAIALTMQAARSTPFTTSTLPTAQTA